MTLLTLTTLLTLSLAGGLGWAGPLTRADELREADRCAEALPLYRPHLDSVEYWRKAQRGTGICLVETGKVDAGLDLLEQIVRDQPSATDLDWLGWGYDTAGRPYLAARAFSAASDLDPERSYSARRALKEWLALAETEEAARFASRGELLAEGDCDLAHSVAEVHLAMGELQAALDALAVCGDVDEVSWALAVIAVGEGADGRQLLARHQPVIAEAETPSLAGFIALATVSRIWPLADLMADTCYERLGDETPLECRLARYLAQRETTTSSVERTKLELLDPSSATGSDLALEVARTMASGDIDAGNAREIIADGFIYSGFDMGSLPAYIGFDEEGNVAARTWVVERGGDLELEREPRALLGSKEKARTLTALYLLHLGVLVEPTPKQLGSLQLLMGRTALAAGMPRIAYRHFRDADKTYTDGRVADRSTALPWWIERTWIARGGGLMSVWGGGLTKPLYQRFEHNLKEMFELSWDKPGPRASAMFWILSRWHDGVLERAWTNVEDADAARAVVEELLRWSLLRATGERFYLSFDEFQIADLPAFRLFGWTRDFAVEAEERFGANTGLVALVDHVSAAHDREWIGAFVDGGTATEARAAGLPAQPTLRLLRSTVDYTKSLACDETEGWQGQPFVHVTWDRPGRVNGWKVMKLRVFLYPGWDSAVEVEELECGADGVGWLPCDGGRDDALGGTTVALVRGDRSPGLPARDYVEWSFGVDASGKAPLLRGHQNDPETGWWLPREEDEGQIRGAISFQRASAGTAAIKTTTAAYGKLGTYDQACGEWGEAKCWTVGEPAWIQAAATQTTQWSCP